MKFLKTDDESSSKFIFYVKDGKMICRYNMKSKESHLIGTTNEQILSFYITPNKLRQKDKEYAENINKNINDLETGARSDAFYICCLDES